MIHTRRERVLSVRLCSNKKGGTISMASSFFKWIHVDDAKASAGKTLENNINIKGQHS